MALVTGTTKAALAAGSARILWVVAIDGYKRLLTNGKAARALEAWAGTDWTSALEGIVIDLVTEQVGDPHDPFANRGGQCVVHVKPDSADTFGIEVNRRGAGAFTTLAATIDRDDTALTIRSNTGFALGPSEAHIGTECIAYSGTGLTSMTVTQRGRYTAVGTAPSGADPTHFAEHHRCALDQNQVQMNPLVSQQPRRWIGRRIRVYAHLADGQGNMNAKADAACVFSGRIDDIGDDPNTGHTVITVKHVLGEFGDAVIGRNMYGATAMEGLYIPAGAKFSLTEYRNGTAKNANDLVVVAAGAAGTNQINADVYTLSEICSFLNNWLGGEKVAARTDGQYSWTSPVTTGAGIRTECGWSIADASSTTDVLPYMKWPASVAAFMGFIPDEGVPIGGTFAVRFAAGVANNTYHRYSDASPYRTAVFSKGGPGGGLTSFRIYTENERGEFVNQYDLMPSIIKSGLASSKPWGLFLVDEKLLIQASYANGILSDCFITPLGQSSIGDTNSGQSFWTLGRRADDDAGPVTIRQVFDLNGTLEQIINILAYNTGTPGYNHATYDIRALGLGVGIPGGELGTAFERSVKSLPGAQKECRLRFDEQTTIADLLGGELMARRAFLVWRDGGLVFQRWQTPVVSLAKATLSEANKAAPVGNKVNHKSPTLETAKHARPAVKIDFDPDFTFGRESRYRASMLLEDCVGIDDGGGDVTKPMTIKLRGTPGVDAAAEVIKGYLATMPTTSRPSKFLQRSLSSKHALELVPGDTVLTSDNYARDPLTGIRRISGRPATLMRTSFNWGGAVPNKPWEKSRTMGGEGEVNFFDVNRGSAYGPAADVDETQSAGGFSAGYSSATRELWTKDHAYSETGEAIDAAAFAPPFNCIIVEKDASNSAAPLSWQRTVESVSGNKIKFTVALSAPAWDPAKQYRIIFDKYSLATAVQRDNAFFADDADEMVEDVEVPYHWCATNEESDWTYNTAEPTEHAPQLSHGDGRSVDVGHEKALIVSVNNFHDHKSAHHPMYMWSEQPLAVGSAGPTDWRTRYFGPVYLGLDAPTNAVFRYLTVAPWLWLDNFGGNASGQVRVTLSRDLPRSALGVVASFTSPVWDGFYSQATWTTVSTTPAIGIEQQLEVRVKDLFWGLGYITIETNGAFCRGLIKGREGARVLPI